MKSYPLILCTALLLFGGCSSSGTLVERRIDIYFANINRERHDLAGPPGQGPVFMVYAAPRRIASTTLEEAALEELFKGPTSEEEARGYSTYCSGLEVKSFRLDGDSATVELTGTPVLSGVLAGPRLRAQINKTLLQFKTIKNVRLLINGKEDFDSLK